MNPNYFDNLIKIKMAILLFKAQADYDEVIKLREEIEKLKRELGEVNSKLQPEKFSELNEKLGQFTQKYKKLIDEAIDTGSKLNNEIMDLGKGFVLSNPTRSLKEFDEQATTLFSKLADYSREMSRILGEVKMPSIPEGFNGEEVEELKKEIEWLTEAVKNLQEEELRERQRFIDLSKAISDNDKEAISSLQRQAKETEAIYGSVTSAASANAESIRTQIAKVREELARMIDDGEVGTPAFQEIAIEAGKLRQQMTLANKTMEYFADPNRQLTTLKEGLQGVAGGFSLLNGIVGLFNDKSEQMNAIQTKIQSLLGIIVGLQTTYNMVKKTSNIMLAIEEVRTWAVAKARGVEAAATTAATVAQEGLNVAMKSNPVGAVLAVVVALGAAIWGIVKALTSETEAEKKAREEAEAHRKAQEEQQRQFSKSVADMAGKNIASYQQLRYEYNKLSEDLNAKKRFVNENKDAFNELGYSVNGVSDAEKLFVQNTDAVVNAMMARAKASAIQSLISDKYKEMIDKQNNAEYGKVSTNTKLSEVTKNEKELLNNADYKMEQTGWGKTYTLTEHGAAKINQARLEKAQKRIGTEFNNQIDTLREQSEEALADLVEANKAIGLKEYKKPGTSNKTKTGDRIEKAKQENTELLNLQKANQKEELDLLKDGVEKEKAIIENAYIERMNELSALQEKWSSEQNGTLTDDQLNTLVTAAGIAFSKRNKEISDIEKAQNEKDEKNRLEYLAKYGSYLEKRNAIIEKYNKELQGVESGSWEEKGILAKQKDELDTLDKTLLEDSELWSKCFDGFENRSTSALKRIIREIQGLIDYMNGVEGAELPDMFAQNENAVKAINDAMKDPGATQKFVQNLSVTKAKFTKMLDEKNPFKQISEGFKNKDSDSMAKGFQQIAGAIDTAKQAMDALGISQDSTLGKVADIAGKTASYAAQGAQIGGAYGAAIGGAIGLASGLVGAFGADYSQYKKLVEEYEGLIDVWDTLIDRKMEYLSMSWGTETSKAREEAIALVNKEAEAWKELGLAKLNAGPSAGSHSIGVRMAKDTTAKDWEDIARGLGMSVSKAREVIDGSAVGGRMQGLFSLSVDQLKSLQENAPAFWAKMDEDVRKYLESIIDGEKKLEDIEKTAQERLTQTTFDNVYNDFVSKLMDMKNKTKDFTQDISEMFMQAMLSNEIGKLYSDKLKKWYEKFAKSIESGTMSSEDRDALSEEYKQYVAEALNIRDELAKATGYDSTYSQSASTGYSVSMSQETGDMLVGRATGIHEAMERLNTKADERNGLLNVISAKTEEIKSISIEYRDIANDTRDIIANSYLELREINENTANSSKYLKVIRDDVTEIRNKTKNL